MELKINHCTLQETDQGGRLSARPTYRLHEKAYQVRTCPSASALSSCASDTEHCHTPTEKLPTQLSCRIECDLPTVSSQELPRATVQAIQHSDKNRLERIWGLKAVCVLQKLHTHVRTHVHIEKQMQAYFCCSRAIQKLLSEAFFPARNETVHLLGTTPHWLAYDMGPPTGAQQHAPSRRECRTRSLCTPKPACVHKGCPTPVLTPLRWARVPSRPSASVNLLLDNTTGNRAAA